MNLLIFNTTDFINPEKTRIRISGKRFEHSLSVLKVKPGEILKVGLANGKLGEGEVTTLSDSFFEMNVTISQDPPPSLNCTLIVALPRPKSFRKVIECAVSLGIKKIYVIGCFRVEKSFWKSPFLQGEKLEEFIINGLEQARDTQFPIIEMRKLFKPFLEDEVPEIIKNTQAYVAHPYEATPCPSNLSEPFTLAIGPEGGFIPYEIGLFKKSGFSAISTGPRILRVENALPVLAGRLAPDFR